MAANGWLTLAELIAAAGTPAPTERQVETWRGLDLIPRPVRRPGGRSVWRYPAGAEEQLRRLLELRPRVADVDLIRIQLWIEQFPVPVARVREALDAFVAAWDLDAASERMKLGDDTTPAIDALGRELAGRRGGAAVPRVVRITAEERAQAHSLMVAAQLGLDAEVERRAPDQFAVERMLGLRSGQGGGLMAVSGLAEGVHGLTDLPSTDTMRAAIAEASDAELELVRRIAALVHVAMLVLAPGLLADEGPRAEPVIRLIETMVDDIAPSSVALFVAVTLARVRARPPAEDDMRDALAAISPGAMELQLLDLLPAESKRAAFDALPERHRRQVGIELRQRSAQRSR